MSNRIKLGFAAVAALVLAGALAACGSDSSSGGSGHVSLVAYSTPQEAYQKVIPAFKKTSAGKGVGFSQSYGASGDQSRAVAAGLNADVVALSLAPDVDKLVDAGKVDANWAKDKYDGFVTNSVVVLATRKGNPKNIKTWEDLIKPGVDVITPNPFTSGGAKWNIMAAYGAQLKQGKSKQQGEDYIKQLFSNVSVQSKSARDALQTFVGGKGDVLIAYENEAITAQQKDQAVDYTIPDQTILIQNPIAVTKSASAKAQDFVDFTRTNEAQQIFAEKGYRPVVKGVAGADKFATPPDLFEIGYVGGWPTVNKEFFDPDNGVMAKINQSLGQPTSG